MSCAEWCHHIISKLWSNKYILYHVNIMYECVMTQTWHNWFQCVWEFRSLQWIKVTRNPWDAWNLLSTGCWAQDWQRAANIGTLRGKKHSAPWRESLWLLPENCCRHHSVNLNTDVMPKSPKNYSSLVCWPSTHSRVFFPIKWFLNMLPVWFWHISQWSTWDHDLTILPGIVLSQGGHCC